nr:biotin carboxyl carrier protein of acetyl-CoA carboxylase-like isoform X1 [Ipomoea batatas]
MAGVVPMNNAAFSNRSGLTFGGKLICSRNRNNRLVMSSAKTPETIPANLNGAAVLTDSQQTVPDEKNTLTQTIFPDGFEALITEVCDDTEIAELKLKAGDFEMHLLRKIEAAAGPAPVVSPTPPPSPNQPAVDSLPAASSVSPSKPSEKSSPFINVSTEKSAKLAALEASGSSGYVLVLSQAVGSFRRARTAKGKKLQLACKEGDIIKAGQTIGFLDQFSSEVPVKADVAGKVLKILYDDGEAVGYGDPLVAVLP